MGISRILKLGIISIVVLFAVVTAMSSLLPSNIIVSRAIDMNVPADSIKNYLNNFYTWKEWLVVADSGSLKVVKEGNHEFLMIGKTKVSITNVTDTLIQTSWKVGEAKPMDGHFRIINHPETEIKTIQWAFFVKVKWYPWEKFASIISDKSLGTFMEPSLDKIKSNLEK